MPNFPVSAPITVKNDALMTLKDAAGKTIDVIYADLPIEATNAQIDALIAAACDITNAGLHKTSIAESKAIPEADIVALDDAESSVTAQALFNFQNVDLVQVTFIVPAPDLSIFDVTGELVLPPASNALVQAYVDAALDVLNAGTGTFAYVSGVRDDVSYNDYAPELEGIAKAQDDANKALLDAQSALTMANIANETAQEALIRATWDSFAFGGDELRPVVGSILLSIQATFPYNWIAFTTTNLASMRFDTQMREGTWTLKILTMKRNDACDLTVSIDGVVVLNQLNLYAAAADNDYLHTITGIEVGSDPVKDIVFLADGNTSPSSGFVMVITKVWGYRTGD